MFNAKANLTTPLMDKLINHELRPTKRVSLYHCSLSELKASVVKDIEFLLNTRKQWIKGPPLFNEAQNSVIQYGLLDFSKFYSNIEEAKSHICQNIKESLIQFEPRIAQISVEPLATKDPDERCLTIQINAQLKVAGLVEAFTLNTKLDPSDLSLSIAEVNR